jgi:hypothetical protein
VRASGAGMRRPAGYSGTPLVRKLGIRPAMRVITWGAPPGFPDSLGPLPEGASLRARGAADLAIWFVRNATDLERGMARAAAAAPVWIAWRKKAARPPGAAGPTEDQVRRAGLAAGLVDHKVCAIDAQWSGLLFARRRR